MIKYIMINQDKFGHNFIKHLSIEHDKFNVAEKGEMKLNLISCVWEPSYCVQYCYFITVHFGFFTYKVHR